MSEHLPDGRDLIPDVHPVQVDVVGAEAAQRTVERAVQVLAAVAARERVSLLAVEGVLGGEDDAVAQAAVPDVGA